MEVAISLNNRTTEDDLPVYRASHERAANTLYITGFEQVENVVNTGTGDVRIGYDDGDAETIPDAEIATVRP